MAYWDLWLRQAQSSNDQDQHTYAHGVFVSTPDAGGSSVGSSAAGPPPPDFNP
jgi:hypothetical protein